MATSSSRPVLPSTPLPVPSASLPHRETIEATRLSYLTADAVESVDEAVAVIIELGELAIAKGGNEGSLPPLHAIAVDEFGKFRVVDEDTTNEHPVRALVRFLKSLVSARDFPPALRELLYRNSGRDDELDYTEEFVNALSPLAPADRNEAIAGIARRLRSRRQGIALLSERHRFAGEYATAAVRRPPSVAPNSSADQLARQRMIAAFAVLALLVGATVMGYLWGHGRGQSAAGASVIQSETQLTESSAGQELVEDEARTSDTASTEAIEAKSSEGSEGTRGTQATRTSGRAATRRWAAPKWPAVERWDEPSSPTQSKDTSSSVTNRVDWTSGVGDRWETPRRVATDRSNPPSRGVSKRSSAASSSLEKPIKWPGRVVPVDRTKMPTGNIDPRSKAPSKPSSIGAR